jgi:hypothetical protein
MPFFILCVEDLIVAEIEEKFSRKLNTLPDYKVYEYFVMKIVIVDVNLRNKNIRKNIVGYFKKNI